jgi:hypothetical protein
MNTNSDMIFGLTKKYYGMMNDEGKLYKMPIVCEKDDRYAIVLFKKNDDLRVIGDFKYYHAVVGTKNRTIPSFLDGHGFTALCRQTYEIALYDIYNTMVSRDTLIYFI